MPPVTVIFYARENGQEPAKDFILGLDIKMRAKVLRTIKLLADNGTDLREPSSKSLGSGIFELRIKFGSDITRILYFFLRVLHKECYNDILQLRSSLCNTVQNVRQSGL